MGVSFDTVRLFVGALGCRYLSGATVHSDMMLPLQVPGGVELAVIFLIVLVPASLVVGILVILRRRRLRFEHLQSRLRTLESRVDELEADDE